jgi:hypothetical protein
MLVLAAIWSAHFGSLPAAPPAPADGSRQREWSDRAAREIALYFNSLPNCKYTFKQTFQGRSEHGAPIEAVVEFCKYDNKHYHKAHYLNDNIRMLRSFDGATYVEAGTDLPRPQGVTWSVRFARDYRNIGHRFKNHFHANPFSGPFYQLAMGAADPTRFDDLTFLTSEAYWREVMSNLQVQVAGADPSQAVRTYAWRRVYQPNEMPKVEAGWLACTVRCAPGSVVPEYAHLTSQMKYVKDEFPPHSGQKEWKVEKWFVTPKDAKGQRLRIPSVVVEGVMEQAKAGKLLPGGMRAEMLEETFTLLTEAPPPEAFTVPLENTRMRWDLDRNETERFDARKP